MMMMCTLAPILVKAPNLYNCSTEAPLLSCSIMYEKECLILVLTYKDNVTLGAPTAPYRGPARDINFRNKSALLRLSSASLFRRRPVLISNTASAYVCLFMNFSGTPSFMLMLMLAKLAQA